jgi:hypothetical protein
VQREDKEREDRIERRKEQAKKEEEQRHKQEIENIKGKYLSKLQIEKERIQVENNRLLEESGDIDYQVRLFKEEMLEGEYEKEKKLAEKDMLKELKAYEGE